MQTGLTDKTAFVTGASGGIGRALAEVFAEEGCRLALAAHRKVDELRRYVDDRGWTDRALVVEADVADPEAMDAAMEEAVERFGRIDACVANAGVWPPENLPLHELGVERLRRTIDVNLLGATWTARAVLRQLAVNGPRADGDGLRPTAGNEV